MVVQTGETIFQRNVDETSAKRLPNQMMMTRATGNEEEKQRATRKQTTRFRFPE
jgi:hypothetical protein